ncbi:MAG: class I SAM-dependent methyltransferase [Burkholderiaceae bacterium]|nr:MAG: class I SAM-dependent methyltransferase [Burkholderiaceae bacterium]
MSSSYEKHAIAFQCAREASAIGLNAVLEWAKRLDPACEVLDLACGWGKPLALGLVQKGFRVHGIDHSPTLVQAFQLAIPQAPVLCENILESHFWGKKFSAIIAVGIIFLLNEDEQKQLLLRVASALEDQAHFLLSAPTQVCQWRDVLTGSVSISLGRDAYLAICHQLGLQFVDEFSDEGENHYFAFQKIVSGCD